MAGTAETIKEIEERAEMDAWYSRQARDEQGNLHNAALLQELSAQEYAEARALRLDELKARTETEWGKSIRAVNLAIVLIGSIATFGLCAIAESHLRHLDIINQESHRG